MLIHNKDDIEFVTEFPCFLGHPVFMNIGLSSVVMNWLNCYVHCTCPVSTIFRKGLRWD